MTGLAVLGDFVLDTLFGDPAWLPHPVVLMEQAIRAGKRTARPPAQNAPGRTAGQRHRGFLPAGGHHVILSGLVCLGAAKPGPWLGAGRADVHGAGRHWPQGCRRA